MPRKSGIRNHEQEKTWKENYDKIKRLLIVQGADSYKEIVEKTGLHRNTVRRYMKGINGIEYREKFYRDRFGRMYIEPDWIEVASKLLPEMQIMAENRRVLFVSRLTPEDLKKDQKLIMEGKTKGREIGAVFLFTQPAMKNHISWGLVNLHEREFLHENPYWLRDIFRYALREKIIDEKYFAVEKNIEDIKNEELDQLWSRLFGETRIFMIAFSINPQELLKWIKGKGRNDLRRALPKEVCTQLYREASELWKQREKWDKRLRSAGLEKHFENEGIQK